MTYVGTEARSRQMKFFPPVGDDVTAISQSYGVGHLDKVLSRQAVRVTASAILKK